MVADQEYVDLKGTLHSKVINEIDLESLNRLQEDTAREQLRNITLDLINREKTPLTMTEREQLVTEILDEVFGLGPLQPLLADPTISDILVNGAFEVYVERRGKLYRENIRFSDDDHLMSFTGIWKQQKWYFEAETRFRQKMPKQFRRFKTSAPLREHITPLIKAFWFGGLRFAIICFLIKILSIRKHL